MVLNTYIIHQYASHTCLALLYVKYKSILKVVVAVHIHIQYDYLLKEKTYQQLKHFKNVVQKLKEAYTRLTNHVKIASLNYR